MFQITNKTNIFYLITLSQKVSYNIINLVSSFFPIFNMYIVNLFKKFQLQEFVAVQSNFGTIALFLGQLPTMISLVSVGKQSFNRLDQFLHQEDHSPLLLLHKPSDPMLAIQISNGSFVWRQKVVLDEEEELFV